MKWFKDLFNNKIRFTKERLLHISKSHPEMKSQLRKVKDTLLTPDNVIISKVDLNVNLYYKYYNKTPVTDKYLCVVVKILSEDIFIITVYFTNKIKRGKIKWQEKK